MINQELIRQQVRYENGRLFWIVGGPGKRIGNMAGCCSGAYSKVNLFGKPYFTHRIIWEYFNGPPVDQIDHINGNKRDNRIENLRAATKSENMRNVPRKSENNASGFRGVKRQPRGFGAYIRDGFKQIYVGYHKSAEQAARLYDRAARELHGEFAVLNFPDEVGTPND